MDINMDEGMLDAEAAMVRFLNLIAGEVRYCPRAHYDRLLEMGGY
ncbi:hypothetical protein WDV93_02790 [Pantoea ananatis]